MTNETESRKKPSRQSRTGEVLSISGEKTIRVAVNTLVKHPMYGKYIRRRTKLAVHDEKGEAGVGDVVEIVSCRRLSKRKSWRLVRVVKRSAIAKA